MTLAHQLDGTGPDVLLLHAGVADRRMWDAQAPALATAGHRVLRPDFRGFGDSPLPDGGSYSDAADLLALLDGLGIARTAIVAASYGGRPALELAARHPERITSLILLCADADLPDEGEPSAVIRQFNADENTLLEAGDIEAATRLNVDLWLGPDADDHARARLAAMQRRAFEVQLAAGEDLVRESAPGDPAAVTAPALVVSGAHDVPDLRRTSDRLAELLPGARRLDLPWAGHLPALERPAETAALLVARLRETAA